MAQDDILRKLERQLSTPERFTEATVVYTLVEVRKYIDTQECAFQEQYGLLKMYCDWALHVELSRNKHLIAILKGFDAEMETPDSQTINASMLKYSTLSEFRNELGSFLVTAHLPDITANRQAWINFLEEYAEIVADCPLYTTQKTVQLKNIKAVQLCKEQLPKNEVKHLKRLLQFDIWLEWKFTLLNGEEHWYSTPGPIDLIEEAIKKQP